MSKKRKVDPASAAAAPPASRASTVRAARRSRLIVIVGLALFTALGITAYLATKPPTPVERPGAAVNVATADFVGAANCRSCHEKEYAAWSGSQHERAMQHASDKTVLGSFEHAKFSYAGITSTFFKRDGRYFVNTDGPDGKLHDYEIKYTFGVEPLQQYLVEFPDGRIQALTIAWDSRSREQGGQRWFHLYPGQSIKAGDRLHWTGIDMNWNHQCAECHSTNVRKNFDAAANTFKTTWSEISVACEACHGPGSRHVDWANHRGDWKAMADKGLAVALDERRGVEWKPAPGSPTATRSAPRRTNREIDTCARCHARRAPLTATHAYGRALADTHRPALLEEGLYWPDGQMRDEVYNYASFLQSAMYAKGVTCSDCHDPHTMKPRKPGNEVCTQCHDREHFDSDKHTRHTAGTAAARCVSCHMPTTTYMMVDPRHDHSMRVPRPDRSITLGVPNACNQCHGKQTAQWAAAAIPKWEASPEPGHQNFAEALNAGSRASADARKLLYAAASDSATPAIARASALALLARYPGAASFETMRGALNDADALVRASAVDGLAAAPPEVRIELLSRMLADPVLLVRVAAARALAAIPSEQIPPSHRAALAQALDEYEASQRLNADRPDARSNLGAFFAERGDFAKADTEFRQALAIDPSFVPAAINLADLQRARGDERAADATLRGSLKLTPNSAPLHHALGLSLVRQRQIDAALVELATAARLAPADARYAYVYGVALNSKGNTAQAIAVLEAANRRFGGDTDILEALATMERDRGKRDAALAYARALVALIPQDTRAQTLLRQLEQ